jgi:hypothetical protein
MAEQWPLKPKVVGSSPTTPMSVEIYTRGCPMRKRRCNDCKRLFNEEEMVQTDHAYLKGKAPQDRPPETLYVCRGCYYGPIQ